jgi:hypothetical protein
MPEVIWFGEVAYDGQNRNGRVVRSEADGDLAFEVERGQDAMMQKIWKPSEIGAFREFLIYCGNVIMSQKR